VSISEGHLFWQALESLHWWERENLPSAGTPQGAEVLVWLLKCRQQPMPLKDLYRSSRFSEPTIRACLKVFVAQGFVFIESNGADMRTRFARATAKLEAVVNEYCARFKDVSAHLPVSSADGLPLAGANGEPSLPIEPTGSPVMTAASWRSRHN
jgi:hypothetical protein